MKKMKRILAVMIIAVMTFAVGLTASAASVSVKNTGKTQHKLEAYQIFKGDLNSGVLSNVQWGDNISAAGKTALGDAAAKAKSLSDALEAPGANGEAIADAFAKEVAPYLTGTPAKATVAAGATGTISDLATGYYLIKDEASSQSGQDSAYTKYIIRTAGDASAQTKLDVPTVDKDVKDINDTTQTQYEDWNKTADHDIGDIFEYRLKGTLPSNYADYKTYYYKFTDTMSKGLTFKEIVSVTTKSGKDLTGYYTATPEVKADKTTVLTVEFTNLKANDNTLNLAADDEIYVVYKCQLNSDAVIGSAGNPNKVKLTYSNDPNHDGNGTPPTGDTPEVTNIVFTYKVVVNKVDENNQPLEGAEFELHKKLADGTTVKCGAAVVTAGSTFSFNGLDDGTYVLKETKTPATYNSIPDQEFKITATHDNTKLTLETLNGEKITGVITLTADKATGTVSTDVENKKGSVLPSTGGMGTTIFYIVGSLLVIGAAVVLVTKRRMSAR